MTAKFKISFYLIALILSIVFLYFLFLFFQPVKDIASQKPDKYVTEEQLLNDFNSSPDSADSIYKNKVLEIVGKIKKTEVSDSFETIVFDNGGDYIIVANCSSVEHNTIKSFKNGNIITIKGIYSGYVINDETYMIPAEIKIDKCTVVR